MTSKLSEAELARLERLEQAATPAPWRDDGYRVYAPNPAHGGEEDVLFETKHNAFNGNDAELIAPMRNALPSLLASIRELEPSVARHAAKLEDGYKLWRKTDWRNATLSGRLKAALENIEAHETTLKWKRRAGALKNAVLTLKGLKDAERARAEVSEVRVAELEANVVELETEWDGDRARAAAAEKRADALHAELGATMERRAELARLLDASRFAHKITMEERDKLKRQLTSQRENNHARNVALDALHFVWCNGGCAAGVHRYDHGELTQEIVEAAIRNTQRLVSWWHAKQGKVEWRELSAEKRQAYFDNGPKLRAAEERVAELTALLSQEQSKAHVLTGKLEDATLLVEKRDAELADLRATLADAVTTTGDAMARAENAEAAGKRVAELEAGALALQRAIGIALRCDVATCGPLCRSCERVLTGVPYPVVMNSEDPEYLAMVELGPSESPADRLEAADEVGEQKTRAEAAEKRAAELEATLGDAVTTTGESMARAENAEAALRATPAEVREALVKLDAYELQVCPDKDCRWICADCFDVRADALGQAATVLTTEAGEHSEEHPGWWVCGQCDERSRASGDANTSKRCTKCGTKCQHWSHLPDPKEAP